ncbi:MAG: DUF507 family protein [Candidatus Krumholzibacteriia bacterium]
MRLSEERVSVIARQVADALLDEELVDLEITEERFIFLIESLLLQDLKLEDEIDEQAAAFILKHKPHLEEGSTEWEIELERKKEDLAVARGYVVH